MIIVIFLFHNNRIQNFQYRPSLMSRVISPKFHPANILHYTVFSKSVYFDGFIFEVGVYFKVFVAVLHKLLERDDIIKLPLLNNTVFITVQ